MEVQTNSPEFDTTRRAIVATQNITADAASKFLCTLSATQFERLSVDVATAKNDDHLRALVTINQARILAETALQIAHQAASAIGRLADNHDLSQAASDLVEQTSALATAALAVAEDAVGQVAKLEHERAEAAAQAAANAAKGEDVVTSPAPPQSTQVDNVTSGDTAAIVSQQVEGGSHLDPPPASAPVAALGAHAASDVQAPVAQNVESAGGEDTASAGDEHV